MKAVRAVMIFFIAAAALIVIAVTVLSDPKNSPSGPASAGAQPTSDTIHFDAQDNIRKSQLDQMEAGAGACMERAMHGMLMQGVRGREQLLSFARTTCGSGLKRFLVSQGTSTSAADAYVAKTAEDVLAVELQ